MKSVFEEILRVVTSIWNIGNLWLRRAAIFAIILPCIMLAAATALPQNLAVTVIPILALLAVVALVAVALQKPLVVATATTVEAGRKAISTVALVLGADLVFGVYLSVVPISNDRGLVPLFALVLVAILLLRIGNARGIASSLLVLLAIALTVIFLLGGRGRLAQTVGSWGTATAKQAVPAPEAGLYPGYGEGRCDQDESQDFGQSSQSEILVTLNGGCYHGPVALPTHWNNSVAVPSNNAGDWVSVWCHGANAPHKIHTNGDFEGDLQNCWAPGDTSPRFYLQGHGTIIFRALTYKGGGASALPASTAADSAGAAPTSLTSGPVAAISNEDVFQFGFWPCRRVAGAVFCEGFMRNENTQTAYDGVLLSDLKDDLGNDYTPQEFSIEGITCLDQRGGCWPEVGPQASKKIQLKVDGIVPQAKSLVLAIHLTTRGSKFALPPGFDNTQAMDFSITVPIIPSSG